MYPAGLWYARKAPDLLGFCLSLSIAVCYNPRSLVGNRVGKVARAVEKLAARKVATISEPGRHSDGKGLYLNVTETGARSWLFMWKRDGKRREMGLGSLADLSLKDARAMAADARAKVMAGLDPIEVKRKARASGERVTFGAVADQLLASKRSEWRNAKHAEQWRQTLEVTLAPLRSRPVESIDTAAVLSVLTPLWQAKPETASRVRQRLEAVLDAARAKGYRSGDNPAAWRGHLKHLLAKRPSIARGHHAAMAYADVAAFMASLRSDTNTASAALQFCILTAARSGEVYGARWSEMDLEAKVWTIPAERMKAGRAHRVPLSSQAVALLAELEKNRTSDIVFESPRGAKPLSHVAMAKVIERMAVENATVHGFRSSFRDWAGNETSFPREIAEAALAHVIGDKAEQAYRRSDALERRRELMQAWANYCEPEAAGNVVRLKKAGGASSGAKG